MVLPRSIPIDAMCIDDPPSLNRRVVIYSAADHLINPHFRRVDDLGKAKRRRVDPVPLKYHHDPTFETLVITRTGDVGLPGGCYSVSGVKHGRFSSTEDHAEKLAAPC